MIKWALRGFPPGFVPHASALLTGAHVPYYRRRYVLCLCTASGTGIRCAVQAVCPPEYETNPGPCVQVVHNHTVGRSAPQLQALVSMGATRRVRRLPVIVSDYEASHVWSFSADDIRGRGPPVDLIEVLCFLESAGDKQVPTMISLGLPDLMFVPFKGTSGLISSQRHPHPGASGPLAAAHEAHLV